MTTDDGVHLLPGASACTLVVRAMVLVSVTMMAGLVLLVVGTAGLLTPTAALAAGSVVGAVFVVGVTTGVTGVRRSRAERRRGYTTFGGIAAQNRSFTYVHRSIHQVLARPGQPRGGDGRALVLDPSGSPVPGRSAGSRMVVAFWSRVLVLPFLPVIGLESILPGNVWLWGGCALAVVLVLVVVGAVEEYRSGRTGDREAAAGYTTLAGRAVDDPALTFRDRRTLEVRALPGAPLPVRSELRPRQPAVASRWSVGPGRP